MSDTKFEAGDTVSWMGVEGVVNRIDRLGLFSVEVDFHDHSATRVFLSDGKQEPWHKEPSLKLVSKAKKKITVEYWVNVYKSGATHLCHTKQDAIFFAGFVCMNDSFLKTVHLSKEIEI